MKVILGTVQFGLDYGITNKKGKTNSSEVSDILLFSQSKGIDLIDTAPRYGDAEKILGRNKLSKFNVITKTPYIESEIIDSDYIRDTETLFNESLKRLNLSQVHGLLIHDTKDIYKKGSSVLFEYLNRLKAEKRVNKIGVSVYEPREVYEILEREIPVDILQIPINIFDQRFLQQNLLKEIKLKNIEIHSRSLFLQGLLLSELKDAPLQFVPYLSELFENLEDKGLTKIEATLLFINRIKEIDYTLIGVNNVQQLKEITDTLERVENMSLEIDFYKYSINDPLIIDPRKWGK